MAGGPGIEPGFTDPKSVVLPLDDPPTRATPYPSGVYSVKSFVRGLLLVTRPPGNTKRRITEYASRMALHVCYAKTLGL